MTPTADTVQQSRLAAIVFTDVVGYSARMGRDERGTMALVQADLARLRAQGEAQGGEVLNTMGDGMLLAFPSAVQAVSFALGLQAEFEERRSGARDADPLRHRIGIHVGEVFRPREGGVAGDGVNIAARLEPLAPPGGVCMSQAAYDLVRGRVPMRAVTLGEESLKNIATPVVAWIAAPETVGADWLEAAVARRRAQKAMPASDGPASIAVLPFVNMSADPENEYFSDGLSEELLNVLVKVTELRVIARTSSFAFKGKSVTVGEIARQLAVGHVLEGSVRKAGNRVRVTAQLIRASDDAHLWSETYDRTLDDIFAVQDDISREVVEALKVKLAGPAPTVTEGGTSNVVALEEYLKGRYLSENGSGGEAGLRSTLAAFDAAVARDPRYARAHLERASALWSLGGYGHIEADEADRLVLEALDEALRIAPNLADALALRGLTAFLNGRGVRLAKEDFDRAQSAGPGSSFVQRLLAMFEQGCGRGDAAVRAARKSVELDPLSPRAKFMLSETLYYARRFAEGEAVVRAAIATAPPGVRNLYGGLGCYLAMQGRTEEALAAFDQESTEWLKLAGRAWTHALAGDLAAARQALGAYRERFGDSGSYQYATILALLGERDEALAMLDEARLKRDPGLMGYVVCDPMLDSLRDDSRYRRLVEVLGLTCT